jgi:hypothetical protein
MTLDEADEHQQTRKAMELPGIYGQLGLQCTSAQISELLKQIQGLSKQASKEINRSGTKVELLTNLRNAIESKYASFDQAISLLHDSEENGRQTIFLFKPRNDTTKTKLRNAAAIRRQLFGNVPPDYFPDFDRPKQGLKWVDFRAGLTGRPNDWILKAYGHHDFEHTIKRYRDNESSDHKSFREIREVRVEDVDTVMVVRWRNPDLLEIRVDKLQSTGKAEMLRRLEALKKLLASSGAIDLDRDVVAYSLQVAATNLVKERKASSKQPNVTYRVGSLTLLDRHEGRIDFQPLTADKDIDEDHGRSAGVQALLERGAMTIRLALEWNGDEDRPATLEPPLLFDIEGESVNALSIRSRVSSEVLDYVISKLRSHQ